jgi:hypothetical protein
MSGDDELPPDAESSETEQSEEPSVEQPQSDGPQNDSEAFAESLKNAARQVLEEKLGVVKQADGRFEVGGLDGDAMKEGAQALMMSLMQQLAAGAAKQQSQATKPDSDDNVIDLERARKRREATQGASEFERRVSGELRETFDRYMRDHFVPDGATGQVDVNLDGEVLKTHGPALATQLFGAFTRAVLPSDGLSMSVPLDESDAQDNPKAETNSADVSGANQDEEPSGEDETKPSKVEVKLNVDLAGLLGGLINRAKKPNSEG